MTVHKIPEAGYEVLLFTSYCGDDNPRCSEWRPCPICLGMSNVFRVFPDGRMEYVRQLAPDWNTNDEALPPHEVADKIARAVEPTRGLTSDRGRALKWAAQVARKMFPEPKP